MSLEVVLVVPVLMLLALFVLWAGRGGRAALITDLAAEEAATAAALVCEEGRPGCGELVSEVLRARPGLEFLCIGGPRPVPGSGGEILEEVWLDRGDFEVAAADSEVSALGVLGVSFVCETDGAVAPLRGVFPTVAFRGQASEVAVLQGPPRVGVDDVSVVEGTGGATTLTFTLTLDAPAPQDAVLTYSVVGGGYGGGQATAGDDFMPRSPMQVTISQGDMSAVVEVGVVTDGLYEADETFELVFDPPPLSAGPGSVPVVNIPDRTAVGTIVNDDDLPAVTVGDVSGLETGRGLGFVVGLGAGVGRDVEIVLRTAVDARPGAVAATSGTSCTAPLETVRGNDPTDYIDAGAPATLTFTPGSALSQTVTVGQCDDLVGEPDETLLLRWGTVGVDPDDNPQSGVAVGTISDDEPRLRVDGDCGTDAIDAVSVSEGAGLLVFGVCRTRPNYPDSPADPVVRVRYRTVMHPSSGGRPAEAPGDYAAATGRLVFGASETFKTVAVTVVDDGLDEHDETLRLELFDPSDNASVEADPARRGVGTIRDDDDPPNVRVFDASAPETDDPNNPDDARLSFVVDLDAPSGKTVTVEYWTGDDAAPGRDAADAGADYTAVALPAPPTPRSSIDIAAGATTAEIAVVLVDDAVDEPDPESFVLRLAAFDARFESALDPCPLQQDDPLTTLVDEFVALGRDNCALGLIGDDDLPPFAVVADADADEGGDLGFVVGLFDAAGNPVTSEQEVTVGYQLEVGTALRGDFDSAASTGFDWRVDPPSGTLTIPAGTRERTVELRAAADNIYEPVPETFTLRLTGPVNARLHPEGNPCQEARRVDDCGYGRITESGDPPEVSVEAPLADTPEDRADPSFDGNVMNFRATLDKASTVDSTIRYRTVQRATAGAATGGSSAGFQVDYLTVPGTGDGVTYPGDAGAYAGVTYGVVTVPAGGRAAELPVRVFDDGVDESDETVHVELLAPRSGDNVTVDATADTATGAIADDDAIHLRFVDVCTDPGDVYEACADEGAGDMVFTVGLFDPITNAEATTAVDVTVGVGTVDGTAQAGSDFTAPAATATISANTETATISVPLIDDAYNEADETFQVVLRGGAGTFATIDGNSGQGAIFNDDNPPRVRIADAASVTEGGDAEFAVTLVDAGGNQVAAGQDVYINWRVEHRAADSRLTVTDADDFPPGGLTGTLEILKGVRDPVLAVPVAADTLFEGGTGAFEHFEVHLLLVTDSVDGTADLGGVTATLGPDGAAPCTAGDVADRCARGVVRDNDAEPVVRWVQAAGQAAGVGAAASEGTGGSGGELVFKVGLFDAVGGHAVRSGRDAVVSYSVGDLAAGEAVPSDPAGLSRAVGGTLTGGVWTPDDYDYEAVSAGSGSVTIRAGDETADLAAVAVRPDDVDETDEVLKATLLSAGGAALPPDADRRAWGVVTDDDVAELRLVDGCDHGDGDNDPGAADPEDPDNPGDHEGDFQACAREGSPLGFGVELSLEVSRTVSFLWWVQAPTTGHAATLPPAAGADVSAAGLGTETAKRPFSIAAGARSASIPVGTVDDDVFEADERLNLYIAVDPDNALNATMGDNISVGAVLNDDAAPRVRIADAASVTEGSPGSAGGPARFAVTLVDGDGDESPSLFDVYINWEVRHRAATGTAVTGDGDFAAGGLTGTLEIPAGDIAADLDVEVAADALYEGGTGAFEHFEVHLLLVTDRVDGTADLGGVTATLGPDRPAPCTAGDVADRCARGMVRDNDAEPVVRLLQAAGQAAGVGAAASEGTGGSGGELVFKVGLFDADNNAVRSGRDAVVAYSVGDLDNDGEIPSDPAGLSRAVGGTLTGGVWTPDDYDYAAVSAGSGSVTIRAGDETADLAAVAVRPDDVDETDEVLKATLLSAGGAALPPDADRRAWGVVTDDDVAELRLVDGCDHGDGDNDPGAADPEDPDNPGDHEGDFQACAEEGSPLGFGVELSLEVSRTVSFLWWVQAPTTGHAATLPPAAGADVSAAGLGTETAKRPFSIAAGARSASIPVGTVDDDVFEADERLNLYIAVDPDNALNATMGDNISVGAVLNDDAAPRVRIADAASVTEGSPGSAGGPARFAVTLVDGDGDESPSLFDVYINWEVRHRAATGTAVTGDDDFPAGGLTGTLEIPAGDIAADLDVEVAADALYEGGTGAFEHFEVHLLLVTDRVDGTADLGGVTASLGLDGAAPCAAGDVADRCARGLVRDNDAEPVVRLLQAAGQAAGVGAAASEGTGGSGGELVFKVGLFDADNNAVRSGRDAVVSYSVGDLDNDGEIPSDPAGLSRALGGTLTGGVWTPDDYDYAAVSAGSGSVTIRAGDETADLAAVAVRPDDVDETDEVLKATLLSAGGAALPPDADRRAWGVVTDDDVAELRLVDGCDHGDGDNDPGAADPEDPDNPGDHEGDFQACAEEGSPLGFGVELSLEVSRTVTFQWWVQAPTTGHAATLPPAAGADVSAAGLGTETAKRRFTIAAGTLSDSIGVGTVDDDVFEADERLNLRIEAIAGVDLNASLARGSAVGAVLNDDAAPRVRIADAASVTEGSPGSAGGPARFAVTLTDGDGDESPSLFDVYINWEVRHRAATGTAVTDDGDFPAGGLTGTLHIPAGDTAADLDVEVAADALYEGGTSAFEHFEVHLLLVTDSVDGTADLGGVTASLGPDGANPCAAGVVTDRCARGLVRDNDAEPVVRLLQAAGQGVAAVGAVASEGTGGSGGELVFKVGLFDAVGGHAVRSGRDAVVSYSVGDLAAGEAVPSDPAGLSRAVGGTLTGGVWTPDDYDYEAVSAGSGQVTIRAGDETADLAAVAVRPDDVDETDEVLKATLVSAGGAALPPDAADRRAWGVVTDDDVAELRLVDGCDHGDGDDDPGAADPEDPDNPGDHEGDFQACAEEGSPLGFGVELSLEVSRPVTFQWWVQAPTTGHAATLPPAAGADVSAAGLGTETAKRRFSIAAGTLSDSIGVGTVDDDVFEADERLNLRIEAIAGVDLNASLARGSAVGAVLNDDAAPRVRIADAASVTEGSPGSAGGPARFAVTLTDGDGDESPSIFDVYIRWEVRHRAATGTAVTDDGDFPAGGLTGTLEIPAGDTSADLDVEVAADALFEGGTGVFEHFEVYLLGVTDRVDGTADLGGVTASLGPDGADPCTAGVVTDRCARGLVRDNDAAPSLSVSAPAAAVPEGGVVEFTVSLSAPSGREASVDYATSVAAGSTVGQGAACGDDPASMPDLVEASGTLVFDPADPDVAARTSKTVPVQSCDDVLDEDEEAFELGLSGESGATLAAADAAATGLIADTDPAPRLGVAPALAAATEGEAVVFTVSLSAPSGRDAAVSYFTVHGRGSLTAGDGDYAAVPEASAQDLVFEPGEPLEQTVTIATTDDAFEEGEERFQLRLKDFANADRGDAVAVGAIRDECIDPAQTDPTADDYGAPTLSAAAAATVAEGDALTVAVALSEPLCVDAVLSARAAAGTAGRWDAPVTAAGEMVHARVDAFTLAVSLEAPTLQDAVFEGDETFTLHLNWNRDSDPYADVDPLGSHFPDIGGADDVAVTVTVVDDDPVPNVSVAAARAGEGDADIEFTVRLDTLNALPVDVNYWTRDLTGAGAATEDVDYDKIDSGDSAPTLTLPATAVDTAAGIQLDGSVGYSASPPQQTATVALIQDTASEGDERFQLRIKLAAGSTDRATLSPSIAVGTIIDDDCVDPANTSHSVPTLTFADATVTVDETDTAAQLQVTINPPVCEGAAGNLMSFTTADGTATAGTDYTHTSGQRGPGGGVRQVDFTVAIRDDNTTEPDETFEFQVAWRGDDAPQRFRDQAPTTATVEITDDDLPTITFTQAQFAITEEDADLVFHLELDEPAQKPLSVQYTTLQFTSSQGLGTYIVPATAGEDYTHTTGTLTMAAGDSTATITVPVLEDRLWESGEKFRLDLHDPAGVKLSQNAQNRNALGLIQDDDSDNQPSLELLDPDDATEGDDIPVTVRVTTPDNTTNASGRIARFRIERCSWGPDPKATVGDDYVNFDQTVDIPAGQTEHTLTIETVHDLTQEDDENICIQIRNGFRATLKDPRTRYAAIIDDDEETTITVTGPSDPVEEGGTLTFALTLTEPVDEEVTVTAATSDGTAVAATDDQPGDYTAVDAVVTFAPGETYKTVDVATVDDDVPESDETLSLTLSNPEPSERVGVNPAADAAEGVIAFNDRPVITVEPYHVCETDGHLEFTVTVELPAGGAGDDDVTVDYSTAAGDDTTAGVHFTHQESTLTFSPGLTLHTVKVPVINDHDDNPTRHVHLELQNPQNAVISPGHHTTVGEVYDDEGRRTVHYINPRTYEGDPLVFEAAITEPACEPVVLLINLRFATSTQAPATYTHKDGDDSQDSVSRDLYRNYETGEDEHVVHRSDYYGFDDNAGPTFTVRQSPRNHDVDDIDDIRTGSAHVTIPRLAPSVTWTFQTREDDVAEPECQYRHPDSLGYSECITYDHERVFQLALIASGPAVHPTGDGRFLEVGRNAFHVAAGRIYDRPEWLGADDVVCVDPSNEDHPVPVVVLEPGFVVVGEDAGRVETRVSFDPPFCADTQPEHLLELELGADHGVWARDASYTHAQANDYRASTFSYSHESGVMGVSIANDSRSEFTESLLLSVRYSDSSLPERFSEYPGAPWTIVIEDDEAAPVVLDGCAGTAVVAGSPGVGSDSFVRDLRVQEGVPCSVSLTLTKVLPDQATLKYRTVAKTATAGSDFTHVEGTVTFEPGERHKRVALEVLHDAVDDDGEIFFFEVYDPSRNIFLGEDDLEFHIGTLPVPTINVGDRVVDEGDITLAFVPFRYVGTETHPTHVASFDLRSVQRDVHGMPFGTVPAGTGEHLGGECPESGDALWNSADVPGLQGQEVFYGTFLRVWVRACEDDLVEGDEVVEFEIHNLAGAVSADRYGTITIRDNDEPPVLAWTDTTVDEGDAVTITVQLPNPPLRQRDATVEWTTVDGTAAGTPPGGLCTAGSGRYVQDSGTLTFAPDETEKTITITTCENTATDGDRTFSVQFSAPSLAALPSGDDAVSVQIKDDD